MCRDVFHENNVGKVLCLNTEPYHSINLINNIIETIKDDTSIASIWTSGSQEGQVLLENDTGLPLFSVEYKSSHAYNSALIIVKILYTKNKTKKHYEHLLKENIMDNKIDWFKQVLKAICLHGLKELLPKLDITKTTDFYSAYLMVIDELQTYGRQLPFDTDTRYVLINPKDVGFHWDTANPKRLVIDIVTRNTKLRKEYAAHNYDKIFDKLSKKIDTRALANIITKDKA